jgi:hypothetical protein
VILQSKTAGRKGKPACRHFEVAIKHDSDITFPEEVSQCLNALMQRIELQLVWQHGAMWEVLAMEKGHSRTGLQTAEMQQELVLDSVPFMRAGSIVFPLKAFTRSLTTSVSDWVRLQPLHSALDTCC